MLGAWAGHVVAALDAAARAASRGAATPPQVPLAVVMVALTTLTLWSLGQAIVVTRRTTAPAAVAAVADGSMRHARVRRSPPAGRPGSGTHSPSERTVARRPRSAGASASAAATAVSIAVRQRMPSAVAAWRISAASRTAPERGVGVLTTSRTSPARDQLEDRRPRRAPRPAASPSLATGRAS